jgi:hypothetical protein
LALTSFMLKCVFKTSFVPIQRRVLRLCFHVLHRRDSLTPPFTLLCQDPGGQPSKAVLLSFSILKEEEDKVCAVSVRKVFIWFSACLCSDMEWCVNKRAAPLDVWVAPSPHLTILRSPSFRLHRSVLSSCGHRMSQDSHFLSSCDILASKDRMVDTQERHGEWGGNACRKRQIFLNGLTRLGSFGCRWAVFC